MEYGYIVMDCPHMITPLGTPAKYHKTKSQGATMKTGTGEAIQDHNLISTDTTAQVITIHTKATPGHNIGIIAATPGVAHDAHTPHIGITAINPTSTHHTYLITDHPHMEVLQLTTPEIEVDHAHNLPTNLQGETHTNHIHIPVDHVANHTSRRTQG